MKACSFLMLITALTLIISVTANWAKHNKTRTIAIEHGCAEYNATTGDFQWISIDSTPQ